MRDSQTPLLDAIALPEDLRRLPKARLRQLADELRQETINAVSVTGGHLGAGLGVVELTVALHYTFDTPNDRLIWDVGHQAYPHKILTGRRDRICTLRQGGGLSGFTKRAESEFDPFGAAHSSTSISAALGMAVARDLDKRANNVVAVIGDGAMSAGMAYEAMNKAGAMDSRLIVILNDNDMSIAPPVGALSSYLSRLLSGGTYRSLREGGKQLARRMPKFIFEHARRAEELTRGFFTGGTLFEQMGFYYVGPIDGHNLDHLLPVLKNVRDAKQGPILVHVVTKKGKGYAPAEAAADKLHGVNAFDVVSGAQVKPKANAPSYASVFGESLIEAARVDEKIVGITAAMPGGTGIDLFARQFPDQAFDVGIAEQHAVTFAAGLAAEGYEPFCAIYSTFLQRAYDQIVHDVTIQNLPVRFAIDRAGLVGADGATHAGSFDIAYLGCLPNMVLMAAADEAELKHMVATAAAYDSGPIALRYPRGDGVGVEMPERGEVLDIGKGRVLRQGSRVAVAWRAIGGMPQGGGGTGRPRPVDHRGRRPLRQTARHGARRESGVQSRSAGDGGRGLIGRFRIVRVAASGRDRAAGPGLARARHDASRRVPRSGQARAALRARRARRQAHRRQGSSDAAAHQGGAAHCDIGLNRTSFTRRSGTSPRWPRRARRRRRAR